MQQCGRILEPADLVGLGLAVLESNTNVSGLVSISNARARGSEAENGLISLLYQKKEKSKKS